MSTTYFRSNEVEQRWLLYDASEHNLGRMAAKIAMNLMGKDRPTYTANHLTGAHVVVINAEKAKLTGKKGETKNYAHYTKYPGGYKLVPLARVREARATDIVTLAVRRMLPKSKLGHDMLRRLKVYEGAEHPHVAQAPVKVEA
ncbi:MAG: 50S ribosomal protein L13 [Planctomycetes bacterium]|nr:50S ribosomal protein L13 [Planctomycetota bacterium]